MIRTLLTIVVGLGLGACSGSDSIAPAPAPDPAPPPAPTATKFSDFVTEEIAATSDTREPVEINAIDFDFGDDPNAFDSLFPAGD